MADLILTDFYLLRSVFLKTPTQWTPDALSRCQRSGLVNQDGTLLTSVGAERASVFNDYIEALWRGVDLSVPRTDLSHAAATQEEWYRKFYKLSIQYQYSPHAVIFSDKTLQGSFKRLDKHAFTLLMCEWGRKVKAKGWEQTVAYAYQMERRTNGMKVICFRGIHHGEDPHKWSPFLDPERPPKIERIQAHLYDLVMARYPDATWWRRSVHGSSVNRQLAARVKVAPRGKGYMGNGFVAMVALIETKHWPIPLYFGKKNKGDK